MRWCSILHTIRDCILQDNFLFMTLYTPNTSSRDLKIYLAMALATAIVGLCVVFCLLKICTGLLIPYMKKLRQFESIPKHRLHNWPIIGHSFALRGDPLDFFKTVKILIEEDVVAKGRSMSILWIGTMPIIVLANPDTAAEVLRSSEQIDKAKELYSSLLPWLGEGLLTSTGSKWKHRRRILTPTFHFSILQDFLEVMNEQTEILVNRLEKFSNKGSSVNIFQYLTLCALDIICETAMGKSIKAQSEVESKYALAIYRVSEIIQERQKSPWLIPDAIFNRTSIGKEFHQLLTNVLHKFTVQVIEDRMSEYDINTNSSKKKRLAFLDMLLKISKETGDLSFKDIQEEVDTFMFEGHDTTTAGMSFAVHLIGKHPNIQKKMQEEIDQVFSGEVERNLTMSDLNALKYTEAVIKEALRLFPSVPFIARSLSRDIEIENHVIPKDTMCLVPLFFLNRNQNYWDNPTKFDPDRFMQKADRHPYAYVPFSAGPRNCIGQKFALMEEKVIITHLLRRYNVESLDDTDTMPLSADLILRPVNGINVKLTKR